MASKGIWLALAAGIAASVLGSLAWRDSARDQNSERLAQAAGELAQRLSADVRRHDQLLLGAAGLFAGSYHVTRDEFSAYAAAVELKRRLPEARSIAWIRGRPASARVVYAEPHTGWSEPGRPVGRLGGLAGALARSRDQERAVLIRTYDRRTGKPGDLAMVRPVRDPRGDGLIGWVALKLRTRGFLAEDMRAFAATGRALLVSPAGQTVSWSTMRPRPPVIDRDEFTREDRLDLTGGPWVLRSSLGGSARDPAGNVGPTLTLVLGVMLSVVLFLLLSLARVRARAVRETDEQFRTLAVSSPVGICLLNDAEEAVYVNDRWGEIHGIAAADALGKEPLPQLQPSDRVAWQAAVERGRQGEETALECRVPRPDGGDRWISYRGAPMRHRGGEIRGWVVTAADATGQKAYETELRRRALYDEQTGLPNRALLTEQLSRALAAGTREGRVSAVLFIDLDRLKLVNDSYGHAAGDEVIRAAARRLDQSLRPGDTVGRFAGDEFVVVCENVDGEADVLRLAERLVADLGEPVSVGGRRLSVTASIGIAFGRSGDDPAAVLRDADAARHQAKLAGGGGVKLFDALLNLAAHERLELEADLREAVARDELELHYQPIVELPSRRTLGFEALLRWRRGDELVRPDAFIPVAEETGQIVPIGRWVLGEACEQAARWNAEHDGGPLCVSVNVSARQITEPGLPEAVSAALAASGLEPERLLLEITESLLVEPGGETLATLERIRRLGVRLSMDDFGTGWSSLSYLKSFPIEELKIDRAFVTDLAGSSEDCELVAAIIAMANALGFGVVAEGVETEEQLQTLVDLGVTQAQGYLFSPPVPASEAAVFVAA
ncbi:MAG: EAL domain-containing protein [Thermoleophilaceae bacterium]|nr:EAL domain-containing protein [Thermoleophilaceae bacterium]